MKVHFTKALMILVALSGIVPCLAEETMAPQEFQAQALQQNLDLQLENMAVQQADAESSGIRVPSLEASFSQMQMKGGGSAQGWQISQSVPFPTKIISDYKARQYSLGAKRVSYEAKTQEIKAMSQFIYFLVWESQEQERIVKEKIDLLNSHLKIARSVSRSDTFAKVHLLKVASELDQARNELEMLSQIQKERMTVAAQFLNKHPASFDFKAQDPGLSHPPLIGVIEKVPQVRSAEKQVQQFEALEKAKRAEWLPDLKFTYSHMQKTVMFPENEQIMVGVSLPFLYFWQPKSASNQASAKRVSAEIELQKTKRFIQANKVNLEKTIDSLKSQIKTLTENVLPRAFKRKRLFQNVAPRDLSSLQEHLDTYLSIPSVQLQILSLKSKYEQAVANLAKYKGDEDNVNE